MGKPPRPSKKSPSYQIVGKEQGDAGKFEFNIPPPPDIPHWFGPLASPLRRKPHLQVSTLMSIRTRTSGIMVPAYLAPGGAFSPANLTGLIAWYSSDFGVYSDAGVTPAVNTDPVQQWNDRSGHGYHLLQATAGNRPTFLSAGFNAHPAVQFVGASGGFMATSADTVAIGAVATGSAFAVVSFTGIPAANSRGVSYMGTGHTTDFGTVNDAGWIMLDAGSDNFTSYRNGFLAASALVVADTPYRVGSIFDGINNTPYLDNVAGATAAFNSSFTSPGAICVGSAETTITSSAWNGMIVEIVICSSALTSTERDNLQTYFTRWN